MDDEEGFKFKGFLSVLHGAPQKTNTLASVCFLFLEPRFQRIHVQLHHRHVIHLIITAFEVIILIRAFQVNQALHNGPLLLVTRAHLRKNASK